MWSPRIESLEEVQGRGTGKELFSLICSHGAVGFGFPPHITLNNEAGREWRELLGGRGRGHVAVGGIKWVNEGQKQIIPERGLVC